MSELRRKITTHHFHPTTGKRCRSTVPGATSRTVESKKWYGTVGGKPKALHRVKSVALKMLVEMREAADLDAHDAGRRFRAMPLATHLEEYMEFVASGGRSGRVPVADHLANVRRHVSSVVAGCGWKVPTDMTETAALRWLRSLTEREPPAVTREEYTRAEVAAMLGVSPRTVTVAVTTHGLARREERRTGGRNPAVFYPAATVRELARRSCRPASRTHTQRVAADLRRFSRWLWKRCDRADPLADVRIGAAGEAMRHERRSLTGGEIAALLDVTRESAAVRRHLDGPARYRLYLLAIMTGLRRGELSRLTRRAFDLDADPPTVRVVRRSDKARRGETLPLHASLADELRGWLATLAPDDPAIPETGWSQRGNTSKMLRADLAAAGVAYVTDGPDGELFADMHAMRHTFIALLERAGVSLKMAMQLARHSKVEHTARIYGQANMAEKSAAINRVCLPDCLPVRRPDRGEPG